MIKGNMHLLLEYNKLEADINELKLMMYNDNLSKHYITGMGNNIGEEVIITFVYEGIDAYKFKAKKVNAGLLIEDNAKYFSFINWE